MRHVCLIAFLFTPCAAFAGQINVDPVISYQGQLNQAGEPFNGSASMTFTLWDGSQFGNQIGDTIIETVSATNGLFQVDLDFGPTATWDEARFLQIEVDGQVLSPRQILRPAPFALHALSGGGQSGNDFPQGLDTLETRFYNRAVGDYPVSPEHWTVVSVRQSGSAIPVLQFHGPEHPVIGDPGSVFELEAVSGQARLGRSDKGMDLTVRGDTTVHEDLRVIGDVEFEGASELQGVTTLSDEAIFEGDATFHGEISRASPIARSFAISPSAITPSGDVQWRGADSILDCAVGQDSSGTSITLTSPVHLPQGAQVLELEALVEDNYVAGDLAMRLIRRSMDSALNRQIMASFQTSGVTGPTTISDTTISNAIIDNASFSYHFEVQWNMGSSAADFRFCWARIDYQVDKL